MRLLLLLLLLSGCATAPDTDTALLEAAIDAAGGDTSLARARTLHWTGEATVFAGERRIELGVDTMVTPFLRARSTTWLRDQPETTRRVLAIDGANGWTERDGRREEMPDAMREHERLQYAVYGLMQLAPLRAPGVRLQRLPDRDGLRVLHVEHPSALPADLFFDARNRLVAIENSVPDPERGTPVAQRFSFEGDIVSAGAHWPRTLRISQDGRPYFELRLRTLEALP
ncbi:MAG TPA: hypothetical protein VNS59_02490 [Lysobacter sp.]|nr:hypothetical protein [Lysobacter sp.]